MNDSTIITHEPVTVYEIDPVNGTWVYEGDERKVMAVLCSECSPIETLDSVDEGEYEPGLEDVFYPCPNA